MSRSGLPRVMVVGNVVGLRNNLQWYEKKPLFGHRILITGEYSEDYEPLEELGAEIFEFPTTRTADPETYDELDRSLASIRGYDWLIFAGLSGFTFFLRRFLATGLDIRDLRGIKLCAADAVTTAEIERWGMRVDLVSNPADPQELLRVLHDKAASEGRTGIAGLRFLLPGPVNGGQVLPDYFGGAGAAIDTPVTYATIKRERHGKRLKRFLTEGRISVTSFTSAAAYHNFVEIVGAEAQSLLARTAIAVIDSGTARAAEKAGFRIDIIPAKASIPAMVEAIVDWAESHRET